MKVVHCFREGLYEIVSTAFRAEGCRPAMIELGVLNGNNAQCLMEILGPRHTVLVDSWSAESLNRTYCHFDELPPWVLPLTVFDGYFGGDVGDQATFERLYDAVVRRFEGRADVEIVRDDTVSAFENLHDRYGEGSFDFIYVDANHQYEYVLRDLLYYQYLLSADGVIMLNDCNHSKNGMDQNLGVLEAVGNFIKRTDFTPLAITHNDGSDLVIARSDSAIAKRLDAVLDSSELAFVEVMPQMLSAAHVRVSPAGLSRISFV